MVLHRSFTSSTKTKTIMTVKEFNDLLITNSDFLQPVAVSLTHDSEEAKDLIQETLYRALANREKYQTGTNIKAWLYTIMRNIFINNYRRNKKFTKVTSDVPQDYFMFQTDKVASNGGLINSGIREIKGAINRLPDIFRLSFELHYLGYKYQEIADALNEPLGTIKSRIHFARKILSSKLAR
jgi:RNA polymerase sigma factor (sigma-70 family)